MNRGLSDVSLGGLTGFSKLKRESRGEGRLRIAEGLTETSERPRFTGLPALVAFLRVRSDPSSLARLLRLLMLASSSYPLVLVPLAMACASAACLVLVSRRLYMKIV